MPATEQKQTRMRARHHLECALIRHVIKPGMETGNEMERNEINLQCSGGYSLRNIL